MTKKQKTKRFATFVCNGLSFDVVLHPDMLNARKSYYWRNRGLQELYINPMYYEHLVPRDKCVENMFKGIVALILRQLDETTKEQETFITPVGSLLHQFWKTDKKGKGKIYSTFTLNGIEWIAEIDNEYCYHSGVMGESCYSRGRIILEDTYEGVIKKPLFVRQVYIHEVVHAIFSHCYQGRNEKDVQDEAFVNRFGLLLFEILLTLKFVDNRRKAK